MTNRVTYCIILLEVIDMYLGKENETIEFKASTGELHQAVESIASILNKHGYGELYFGVNDNGEVKGQIVKDSTIKTVADSIIRDIEPRITPTITTIIFDGKDVIKVIFSGSQKPYSAFGKYLIRVGTQNRQMTRDELRRLIKNEDYSYPWEKENNKCTIDDIDDNSLHKYYEEAVNCGRLEMPYYNKEALLTTLELLKDGVLNNAAIALFGKNANIQLKLACFATDKKITFTDLNELKGNIYTLMNEGVTYILNHINWKVEIKRKREEYPEIPVKAIREIVVNAFAHAIYEPTPEVEINIHPGMVTIFNPGTFPDDLSPEDYVNRNISSVKRNPLILDVLYRCKDVEKSGSGFKRMNELCSKEGIKWSYEKMAYGFYFTFYRGTNVTLDVSLYHELSEEERVVLIAIKNNPKITREELASKINKTTRTIQRIVNRLVDAGYVTRIGKNRFGYWKVIK